jgi:hypothetical protein
MNRLKHQYEQASDGVRPVSWHEAGEICFVCCPEVVILRSHGRLAYRFAAEHADSITKRYPGIDAKCAS